MNKVTRLLVPVLPLLGLALLVLAFTSVMTMAEAQQATGDAVFGLSMAGLLVGSLVKVDLDTVFIDANKKTYAPGTDVEMPQEDAERLGLWKDGKKVAPGDAVSTGGGDTPSAGTEGSGGTASGSGGGSSESTDATALGGQDPIPDSFPGYGSLTKAGYKTMQDVRDATREDLLDADGIGEKTADAIIAARGGE